MKIIEFNLDYYKENHPMLETRDGKKVRIICTDRKPSSEPIVALILDTDEHDWKYENILAYYENGHYLRYEDNIRDLMMLINE